MNFLYRIEYLFSTRISSAIIVLLSIAGRIIQKIFLSEPRGDKVAQIFATKNFIAGHGISSYEVAITNLADPQYIPLIKWPPGYSILLAPFYALSGERYIWGSLFPDILAAILFVVYARKTIRLFDAPTSLVNFYTIIAGFFLYDFCISSSSDLITATLFEMGLYYTLRFSVSAKKTIRSVCLIGLLLFAAGAMRYMLLPISFVIPAYFIFYGYMSKERDFISRGKILFLLLLILSVALFVYQKYISGQATYIIETEKGFYPGNLLPLSIFLFSPFINGEFLCVQLSSISGISYIKIAWVLIISHLLVLFAVCIPVIRWLRAKPLKHFTLFDHFIYIGILTSLATLLLLSFLSLSNAPVQVFPDGTWTFVTESRYFFIPVIFLQLFVILYIWKNFQLKTLVKRILLIGLIVMTIQTIHSIYFTAKIPFGSSWFKEENEFKVIRHFKEILKKIKTDHPGKQLVVASSEDSYVHYAGLFEQIPKLVNSLAVNGNMLRTSRETILILILRKRFEPYYKGFLDNPNSVLVGKISDYSFYTLHVQPEK